MAKTTAVTNTDQLSLTVDEQDAVVFGMLTDEEFLAQCSRRNLKPQVFASESRQLVVNKAYDFFAKYSKAPGNTILDLFEEDRRKKQLQEEKHELVFGYLTELIGQCEKLTDGRPVQYLLQRLDEFVKRRVAFTAANEILGKMGTVEYNPDLVIDIMRTALNELDECTCRSTAEDMREDELVTERTDVVASWGIPTLDDPLNGGLHTGQFVVIQAFTNRGKSQSVIHLAKRAVRVGNSCLVIPTEMSNRTWRLRWKQSVTGLTSNELRQDPKLYQQQRKQIFRRQASVYLLAEEEKSLTVDTLGAVLDEIKQRSGRKVELLLLDSADDLNPPSGIRYREKIERTTAIYTYLKNFAKDRDICVVTTSQSNRGAAKRYWTGSDAIGDDINKVRKAHVGISINAKDAELRKDYARLYLFKHTDGPVGAKCWIRNDYNRGQFAYYSEEYLHEAYKEIMKKEGILNNEQPAAQ